MSRKYSLETHFGTSRMEEFAVAARAYAGQHAAPGAAAQAPPAFAKRPPPDDSKLWVAAPCPPPAAAAAPKAATPAPAAASNGAGSNDAVIALIIEAATAAGGPIAITKEGLGKAVFMLAKAAGKAVADCQSYGKLASDPTFLTENATDDEFNARWEVAGDSLVLAG